MYSEFLLQETVRVGGLWVRMEGKLRVGWLVGWMLAFMNMNE